MLIANLNKNNPIQYKVKSRPNPITQGKSILQIPFQISLYGHT